MVTAATRRDARERAIELLYEADSKSLDVGSVVAALPLSPDAYALELAFGVEDHQIELDQLLGRYARRWSVARMAVTDRAVLRLGAFELATQYDVPTGAALSEAVELGARYGSTDETSRFVNGVLAAVSNEVRDGARPWQPIDMVVFDMDGVIRHWDTEELGRAEAELGLEPGTIASVSFQEPLFQDTMTGVHTAEEWAEQVGATVAADPDIDVDADAVAQLWLTSPWTIDDDVVATVRSLKAAGTRVAVFSNATTRFEADLVTMGLDDGFDVVANSARLGLAKPDGPAFDAVAELVGSAPERTLFVDDRVDNVTGAVDAGWHAIRMRGSKRLGDVLRRLAVPGAPHSA